MWSTPPAADFRQSHRFAALWDAITQPGPAVTARFPNSVCSSLYATGVEPRAIAALLRLVYSETATLELNGNLLVKAEPKVKKYFKH